MFRNKRLVKAQIILTSMMLFGCIESNHPVLGCTAFGNPEKFEDSVISIDAIVIYDDQPFLFSQAACSGDREFFPGGMIDYSKNRILLQSRNMSNGEQIYGVKARVTGILKSSNIESTLHAYDTFYFDIQRIEREKIVLANDQYKLLYPE